MTLANTRHMILDRDRTVPRMLWVQPDRSGQDATS